MTVGKFIKEFLNKINEPTQKVRCFKCGGELEFPNPPSELLNSWGCITKVVFTVANLIANGWHVRNRGIHDNHPYYCPKCWDGTEPEYGKHPLSDEWVKKGEKWFHEQMEAKS